MIANPAYPLTASENCGHFLKLCLLSQIHADLTLLARCGGAQARVSAGQER
jgi:hypothetical protein